MSALMRGKAPGNTAAAASGPLSPQPGVTASGSRGLLQPSRGLAGAGTGHQPWDHRNPGAELRELFCGINVEETGLDNND